MEDWEKKYFAIRAQQKQHQQITSKEDELKNLKNGLDWKEADITSYLTNKVLSQNTNQNNKSVRLREGYEYYKVINSQNFGHSIPLVKNMGKLSNVGHIEFVIIEETKVFCVDNMNVIDLSKINEQPEKCLTLVKVRSAFNGDLLVNKSAIIENLLNNNTKQLLKD